MKPIAHLPKFLATLLLPGLLLAGSKAQAASSTIYDGLGGSIEKYSSATGADLGTFVSGEGGTEGMVFDSTGDLFVVYRNTNTIEKFAYGGTLSSIGTTFATVGSNDYGLAIDSANNLYVSDVLAKEIYKVTPAGSSSPFASVGSTVNANYSLAVDSSNNVYVDNNGDNAVYKITSGGSVSTFYSGGLLNGPVGMTIDGLGNLYVANDGNNAIVKITPGGTGSLFSSSIGGSSYYGDAFDGTTGNIFVGVQGGSPGIEKITSGGAASLLTSSASSSLYLAIQAPEPGSALLLLGGGALLALRRRRNTAAV